MPPNQLTAASVRKLPRLLLWALLLLYGLSGSIGRDPWKTDDAIGFGLMWTLANDGWSFFTEWLMPTVAGIPLPQEGPLFFWLGAIAIKLLQPIGITPIFATHVLLLLSLALLCSMVWYATFALARRPESQPHDPIGDTRPAAVPYGRMVADTSVLTLIATLGLVARSHETAAESGAVACVALALYGLASGLHRPIKGAILFAAACAGAFLIRGLPTGLVLFAALPIALLLCKPLRFHISTWLGVSLPLGLLLASIWPITLYIYSSDSQHYLQQWLAWNAQQIYLPGKNLAFSAKNFVWVTWPTWPIAGWLAWTQRKRFREPAIALPLSILLPSIIAACCYTQRNDSMLLLLIPPLAVLAAFGLTTLRRSAINALDWFAVMTFSLVCVVVWAYWIAAMTGTPAPMAKSIARLTPGLHPTFIWLEFLLALCVTLAWLWLIRWRISRKPRVLWRSVVLSSGGLVLTWALLTTLWLPWINHKKTYRDVAVKIKRHVPSQACVATRQLGLAERATINYFAQLNFSTKENHKNCKFLLLQDSVSNPFDDSQLSIEKDKFQLIWEGRRAADKNERFRLYQAK